MFRKRILSVLSVSNKNIELAYVRNALATVIYGVSRQAPGHTHYTRATVFECLLRGTYLAVKCMHGPSTGILLYAGSSLVFQTVFLVRMKFITVGSFFFLRCIFFVSFLNVTYNVFFCVVSIYWK